MQNEVFRDALKLTKCFFQTTFICGTWNVANAIYFEIVFKSFQKNS